MALNLKINKKSQNYYLEGLQYLFMANKSYKNVWILYKIGLTPHFLRQLLILLFHLTHDHRFPVYLIGQNFGGQNCQKSNLLPKILSAEKFCPPKSLSAEILSDKVIFIIILTIILKFSYQRVNFPVNFTGLKTGRGAEKQVFSYIISPRTCGVPVNT